MKSLIFFITGVLVFGPARTEDTQVHSGVQPIAGEFVLEHTRLLSEVAERIIPEFPHHRNSKVLLLLICPIKPSGFQVFAIFKTSVPPVSLFSNREVEYYVFGYENQKTNPIIKFRKTELKVVFPALKEAYSKLSTAKEGGQEKYLAIGKSDDWIMFSANILPTGELVDSLRMGRSVNPSRSGIIPRLREVIMEVFEGDRFSKKASLAGE